MSGRPPPEPPTFFATSAMILPACTRDGQVLGHADDQRDLAVGDRAQHHHARPSLLRRLSISTRSCARSRLSARVASTFTPFTSRTFSVAD